MAQSFEDASAITRAGDGTFAWSVPDGWQQGRGAFGGLVVGVMLRAMQADEPDAARAPRSLSAEICAPVLAGDARVRVEVLRRGKGVTYLEARVLQGDGVAARASAAFAAPRGALPEIEALAARAERPIAIAARGFDDVPPVDLGSFGPRFAQHFEYRLTGPAPFSNSERAEVTCGVRARVPPPKLDAPAMAALLDAPWPTVFSVMSAPRPMATITFTMELLVDPGSLRADTVFAYAARLESMRAGLFVELRELWHEGRRVAMNQQTFAVLA
ncbi:MAG TPA: thioesterase family protein [Byssovorax sp.]|jgi:hypothetical protein